MLGNMIEMPLLISDLVDRAETIHGRTDMISRTLTGDIHSYTLGTCCKRIKQLSNALIRLVSKGDVIGTLAVNSYKHMEVYMSVPSIGAVLHTVNPRSMLEDLVYMINLAEDKYLIVDSIFLPIVEKVWKELNSVIAVVVLCDKAVLPEEKPEGPHLISYEELISEESCSITWPIFDENTAASLCFTSASTGRPKGVLYSHRSSVLHATTMCSILEFNPRTTVLPIVPMFHVHAWGVPYACFMSGSKCVFAGVKLDGESLVNLIVSENVSILVGVPSVYLGVLEYCHSHNIVLTGVDNVVVGGSAVPKAMCKAFNERHNIYVWHGYGMTEMSPICTFNKYHPDMDRLDAEARYVKQTSQGKAICGISIKIVDDEGKELPNNGVTKGRLMARGVWVMERYFKSDKTFLEDGWLDTGDIASIDTEGYMWLFDRSADVIKSGGEWISSVELENRTIGHPAVEEACVVGVPHKKWIERPILLVVKSRNHDCDAGSIYMHLEERVPKWWLPDDVIFVESLPHGSTGKLGKKKLREQFKHHLIGEVQVQKENMAQLVKKTSQEIEI